MNPVQVSLWLLACLAFQCNGQSGFTVTATYLSATTALTTTTELSGDGEVDVITTEFIPISTTSAPNPNTTATTSAPNPNTTATDGQSGSNVTTTNLSTTAAPTTTAVPGTTESRIVTTLSPVERSTITAATSVAEPSFTSATTLPELIEVTPNVTGDARADTTMITTTPDAIATVTDNTSPPDNISTPATHTPKRCSCFNECFQLRNASHYYYSCPVLSFEQQRSMESCSACLERHYPLKKVNRCKKKCQSDRSSCPSHSNIAWKINNRWKQQCKHCISEKCGSIPTHRWNKKYNRKKINCIYGARRTCLECHFTPQEKLTMRACNTCVFNCVKDLDSAKDTTPQLALQRSTPRPIRYPNTQQVQQRPNPRPMRYPNTQQVQQRPTPRPIRYPNTQQVQQRPNPRPMRYPNTQQVQQRPTPRPIRYPNTQQVQQRPNPRPMRYPNAQQVQQRPQLADNDLLA